MTSIFVMFLVVPVSGVTDVVDFAETHSNDTPIAIANSVGPLGSLAFAGSDV